MADLSLPCFSPQVYDNRAKKYKESLEEHHAGLDSSLSKRPKIQAGADQVKYELDELNKHYMDLLAQQKDRLEQLARVLSEAGQDVPVSNNSFRFSYINTQLLFFTKSTI